MLVNGKAKIFGITILLISLYFFWWQRWDKHVIGVRNVGFFSNFLAVLGHLTWCEKEKKTPVVYWDSTFPYYQCDHCNSNKNAWERYFSPVSSELYQYGDVIDRNYQAPDGSFLIWNDFKPYDEKTRYYYNRVIKKYINIKEPILKKVQMFYEKNMKGKKTIGMHIRGTDKKNEVKLIPISQFIKLAKTYSKDNQFFIATDEYELLDEIKKTLKGYCIINYDAHRSINKEPIHYKNLSNKIKLGEEILIEMLLLSYCDKFIHGISNVALAVLLFNPFLEHICLNEYC